MSKKNYLEEFVIEDSAIEDFLTLIGRRRFNSLANQVKKVSMKIDKTEFSDAEDDALIALDVYFPIDDAKGALEYFKALAKHVFAKRLYDMCIRIEEKIKEIKKCEIEQPTDSGVGCRKCGNFHSRGWRH